MRLQVGFDMSVYDVNGNEIAVGGNGTDYGKYIRSIAHRGYQTIAPENTIPAFKLAKQMGFDCCESDVRFTSDGVPVMIHNTSINSTARNADGTYISPVTNIADITYEQALTYDFGIWKSNAYAGTKIPTFEQFLALCKNICLHPYIELKTGTQAQIEGLVDIVHRYGMADCVTWASLNQTLLNYVANYDEYATLDWFTSALINSDITYASGLLNGKRTVIIGTGLNDGDTIIQSAIDAGIVLESGLISTNAQALALKAPMRGAMSNDIVVGKVLYEANIS